MTHYYDSSPSSSESDSGSPENSGTCLWAMTKSREFEKMTSCEQSLRTLLAGSGLRPFVSPGRFGESTTGSTGGAATGSSPPCVPGASISDDRHMSSDTLGCYLFHNGSPYFITNQHVITGIQAGPHSLEKDVPIMSPSNEDFEADWNLALRNLPDADVRFRQRYEMYLDDDNVSRSQRENLKRMALKAEKVCADLQDMEKNGLRKFGTVHRAWKGVVMRDGVERMVDSRRRARAELPLDLDDYGPIASPRDGDKVIMRGRKSKLTEGVIGGQVMVNTEDPNYPSGKTTTTELYVLSQKRPGQSSHDTSFSCAANSGAVVLRGEANEVVGQVWGPGAFKEDLKGRQLHGTVSLIMDGLDLSPSSVPESGHSVEAFPLIHIDPAGTPVPDMREPFRELSERPPPPSINWAEFEGYDFDDSL
ncbi:hypothetical protein EJ06DRAFT_520178 [Trichodelitschia bisporula]|uniref:Uncharacterized protein n=1 Tax=Trichodelitschia bisporula TaxID=703511 RepID=A0A6G1I525_9PEZI|nr:hypothetical protein EJ06DRAFT_520178 [Trichodelitschia bisporula]